MGDEKSDPRWKDAPKGDEDIIQVNISLGQLRAMRAALSPAPSEGELVQRDWREDQEHENGNFINRCSKCEEMFFGHKRRVICKACTSPIPSKGGDDE